MGWHTDASHGPWAFVLSLTPDGYHGRAESEARRPAAATMFERFGVGKQ